MEKSDLQALLEEFGKVEEASAQIDTLLRTRRKVLAFPDAKSLDAFYQPIFALAELVRHLIEQDGRIRSLEENQTKLEARVEGLISERQALLVTNQAMITCIRALDQGITHLDTHKFKFSIYDLLAKINAAIQPDERASFEIEGSGVFEAVRFSAARAAEPHMTIDRLLDAGKEKLPPILPEGSPHGGPLRELLEELRDLEKKSAERATKAQKFGLRLKVVNRDERKESTETPISPRRSGGSASGGPETPAEPVGPAKPSAAPKRPKSRQ